MSAHSISHGDHWVERRVNAVVPIMRSDSLTRRRALLQAAATPPTQIARRELRSWPPLRVIMDAPGRNVRVSGQQVTADLLQKLLP